MSLAEFWFVLVAFLFAGYFFLEGFDFGVGMLMPVLGQGRHRPPRHDQYDRAGLGPERDLADRRRRGHVRGLPVLVRHPVQRVLPAAAADPGRVDRARGRVRVPGQGRRHRAGGDAGTPASSSAPSCRRCCGVSRSPTSCAACRSTPTATTPAPCSPCSTRSACSAGWPWSRCSAPTGRSSWRSRRSARSGRTPATLAARIGGSRWCSARPSWCGRCSLTATRPRWVLAALTAAALVAGLVANARAREGWAFGLVGGGVVGLVATLFVALYPDVMPSSTDPAFSLTIENASSTPTTLALMSWVALCTLPFVLAYQGWTYWVFRQRIGRRSIPTRPQHGAGNAAVRPV